MRQKKIEARLSQFLDGEGELTAAEKTRSESCPLCRAFREASETASSFFQQMPDPEPPPVQFALTRIHALIDEAETAPTGLGVRRWALTALALCAAVGLTGYLLLSDRGNGTIPGPSQAFCQVESLETDLPNPAQAIYQDAESGYTVIWVESMPDGEGDIL